MIGVGDEGELSLEFEALIRTSGVDDGLREVVLGVRVRDTADIDLCSIISGFRVASSSSHLKHLQMLIGQCSLIRFDIEKVDPTVRLLAISHCSNHRLIDRSCRLKMSSKLLFSGISGKVRDEHRVDVMQRKSLLFDQSFGLRSKGITRSQQFIRSLS